MFRPNFQQIEEEPEKNYLKYVGLYRMDDMVSEFSVTLTIESFQTLLSFSRPDGKIKTT